MRNWGWLALIMGMMMGMGGCSSGLFSNVREEGKRILEDAKERIQETAEKIKEEAVDKAKELRDEFEDRLKDETERVRAELLAMLEEEVAKAVDIAVEEAEKRMVDAKVTVAKELDMDISEYDTDNDGVIDADKRIAFTQEVTRRGLREGMTLGEIAMLLAAILGWEGVKKGSAIVRNGKDEDEEDDI